MYVPFLAMTKCRVKLKGFSLLPLVIPVLCITFIKHFYFKVLIFLCDAVHGKQLQKWEYCEWKMHLDIVPGLCVLQFFYYPSMAFSAP